MNRFVSFTVVALGLFQTSSSASAAIITYTNSISFPLTNVATSAHAWGSTTSSMVRSLSHGGNPGPYLWVEQSATNYSRHSQFIVFTDSTYDFSQGAIDSLDFSLDYKKYDATFYGAAQLYFIVEQGGRYFGRLLVDTQDPTWDASWHGPWQHLNRTGFSAEDLLLFEPQGDPLKNQWASTHPDFSTSGSPLRFGLMTDTGRYYLPGGGWKFTTLYDNYTVQFTTQAVPEPSTLALLAVGGLGLLPSARRKARRTPNR